MLIRIEMASLDQDLDLFWEYRSGYGSRAVKVTPEKEKVIDFILQRERTILPKA